MASHSHRHYFNSALTSLMLASLFGETEANPYFQEMLCPDDRPNKCYPSGTCCSEIEHCNAKGTACLPCLPNLDDLETLKWCKTVVRQNASSYPNFHCRAACFLHFGIDRLSESDTETCQWNFLLPFIIGIATTLLPCSIFIVVIWKCLRPKYRDYSKCFESTESDICRNQGLEEKKTQKQNHEMPEIIEGNQTSEEHLLAIENNNNNRGSADNYFHESQNVPGVSPGQQAQALNWPPVGPTDLMTRSEVSRYGTSSEDCSPKFVTSKTVLLNSVVPQVSPTTNLLS